MFQRRAFRWIATTAIVLLAGACTGGGGCGGCNMQPLPGGALPADQTIEGGAQVRITPTGFQKLTAVIPGVVNDFLAGGFCVPRQGPLDVGIASAQACHRTDRCAGGEQGCFVSVFVDYLNMSVPDDQTLRIDGQFDVSSDVDVNVDWIIGSDSNCTLTASLQDGHVVADIGFGINDGTAGTPNNGELRIFLRGIQAFDISSFSVSGCGILGDILDAVIGLVADALSSELGVFILDALAPTLSDLITGFLPDPLGIEGLIDIGALVQGVSPGTQATMEVRAVPGGYVSLPAAGMSLGVIVGLNADEDTDTRTPDLDSEPAFCVPPFSPPDFSAAPHFLSRTSRGTFSLLPADEFLGSPDPASDIAIGVAETTLDLAGHHIVTSGAMCLGIGTPLIPQLNLGTIGLFVPSLAELGSADGKDPLLLVLRPQYALDFDIGDGTEASPRLTIHIKDLEIDFYAFIYQRYVRGFTISLNLDAGVNIDFVLDADGKPALQPTIVGLDSEMIDVTVENAEFLRESPDMLEAVFPSILDLALPLVSDGLQPITLPELAGFRLGDLQIAKVVTSQDDFLAIYATISPATAMLMKQLDHSARFSKAAREMRPEAPAAPVVTQARVVDVRTPDVLTMRRGLLGQPGGAVPEIELALAGYDPLVRPLEWQWRLDHGLWHPYASDPNPVVRSPGLALEGKHLVEVRARAMGDYRTFDPTPVELPVVIDSVPPRLLVDETTRDGDDLVFVASDLVSDDAAISFAFGPVGVEDPATDWRLGGRISTSDVAALADGGMLSVFVRDELGNEVAQAVDVSGWVSGFHGRPAQQGCDCQVDGRGAGADGALTFGLAALALMLVLGGGRRPNGWTRRAWRAVARQGTFRVVVIAGWIAGSTLNPGCSCEGDPMQMPPDDACMQNSDCAAGCSDGELPLCVTMECLCTPDVEYGRIGQESSLALASNGYAWVSAYNLTHGDLMVASFPDAGRIPDDKWDFIDGVPDGPVVLEDSHIRGGIFEPGDDVGRYTSIAVAPDDTVMVSYYDVTHQALKFASNAGGVWHNHTIETGQAGDPEIGFEVAGQYSSLTVRKDDGRPGIAYFAQTSEGGGLIRTEVRYVAATNTDPQGPQDWTFWTVDSVTVEAPTGDNPDPYPIPDGLGLFINSARASDGSPMVVYYDRLNGDLKLARFDGSTGQFAQPEVLDGADGRDVGWYPSIVIDSSDTAHVSYVDATTDDLRYINSATRVPQLVDDGYRIDGLTETGLPKPVFHLVGDDSAIVLTAAGLVIAYQDATTHELLLGQRDTSGIWQHTSIAGTEDPFSGGYGFYANAAYDGENAVLSSWVLDQPANDAWVEIFRQTIVVP